MGNLLCLVITYTKEDHCCVMLLGTTAAISKRNLLQWMDSLVASVAGAHYLVFDYSGNRMHGTYSNLTQVECAKVIARLAGLKQWSAECVKISSSCGTFLMIIWGGRGM